MNPPNPPVRIAEGQPGGARSRNALMVASQELLLFGYRQPYHLGHPDQREDLLATLQSEFNRTVVLPDRALSSKLVVYLVVLDTPDGKEPVLVPEADALAFCMGWALAKGGRVAAERLNYRVGMLTT